MLLAQDGYGPSTKINTSFTLDLTQGIILNPKYRSASKLDGYIKELKSSHPKKEIFFDPQFYASTIKVDKYGYLTSYPYFKKKLRPVNFSPKQIPLIAKEVIDYQLKIGLKNIISPALIMDSFDGQAALINIGIYESVVDEVKKKKGVKTFLSIPIGEAALQQDTQMQEYLDDLTQRDVAGVYLLVDRLTDKQPQWTDPQRLAHLMYIVNSLSENGLEVIVGYSDLYGVLLKAVGATALASGWHKNLKNFTKTLYEDKWGTRPSARYASASLLNSILIAEELQPIHDVGLATSIISTEGPGAKLLNGPIQQNWTPENEVIQFWSTLRQLIHNVDALGDLSARLKHMEGTIDDASAIYQQLIDHNVTFRKETGPDHLAVWKESIVLFRSEIS